VGNPKAPAPSSFVRAERARQARLRGRSSGTVSREAAAKAAGTVNLPFPLTPGHEEENLIPSVRGEGGAMEFFDQRGIKWWRMRGIEDEKVFDRPSRHMLSSQISCVNFFMPLARNPAALLALLRAVDDDVTELVPINHQGRTALVEFEWVGVDGPLEPASSSAAASARASMPSCLRVRHADSAPT
jgi:hypothetical protein